MDGEASRGFIKDDGTADLTSIRHYLHENPELSFHEYRTTQFLRSLLAQWGIRLADTGLRTGLAGVICGTQEGNADAGDPCVALRADIDALPVTEEVSPGYASHNKGVMHACGHDIHMAALLGAAYYLSHHTDTFAGRIIILFQPAEELGEGSDAVIASGAVDDADAIIGIHNNPDMKPGEIAVGSEPIMAGCLRFRVSLHAQGSHGARPDTGTGPIEAMAAMVQSLQTVVSRNIDPFHPAVVSVTSVHAGNVWNVVPPEAYFIGTVRTFYSADEELAIKRFNSIVQNTAAAYSIGADVEWEHLSEPLAGDKVLSDAVAGDVPRYAKLVPVVPSMVGEDFARYGTKAPMVFAFIGSNGEKGHYPWHSPRFTALDSCLDTAAQFYVNSAQCVLKELGAHNRLSPMA